MYIYYKKFDMFNCQIKKEFQNIVKLNHPNIVKVLELYIDPLEGKIYSVMEFVEASEMFEAIKLFGSYSG